MEGMMELVTNMHASNVAHPTYTSLLESLYSSWKMNPISLMNCANCITNCLGSIAFVMFSMISFTYLRVSLLVS